MAKRHSDAIAISESEKWLAINALRCAADQYSRSAETFAATQGYEHLARGFRDQATLARALADRLEQAPD